MNILCCSVCTHCSVSTGNFLPRLFHNPFVYSEDLMPKWSLHKGRRAQRLSAHTGKSRLCRMLEKMPTSLWLFHKGPLTLGCLFIILPHPQTHSHDSLLSRAVHVCVCIALFYFFKGGRCLRRESAVRTLVDASVAFTRRCFHMHTEWFLICTEFNSIMMSISVSLSTYRSLIKSKKNTIFHFSTENI